MVVSVDGPRSHAAFAKARRVRCPLPSGIEPKGGSRAEGVYRAGHGVASRARFPIDGDGQIRWRETVEPRVDPGVDGVPAALDALVPTEVPDGGATMTVPRLSPPVSDRDHAQGPTDAPALLVMFGDYECPYTRRAHQAVRQVRRELGDRFRFVYRHFPLTEIHPHALHAALAAEAADAQGRFWEMHDLLFARQRALEDADLARYAGELGLDAARLGREVAAGAHLGRIEEDVASGERSGVEGTPTLFLNGLRHEDGYDAAALRSAIDAGSGSARG